MLTMAPASALAELEAIEAELARRSLRVFAQQAWSLIEPTASCRSNWHLDCIADHLEAVTRGELSDLLINVPPGCSKSVLTSVMWPAWEWATRPDRRYLCGSYDEALSIRDNLRMRRIIESPWFQRHWPLQLRGDQNAKVRFDNVHSGWRIGTSVGGRGTGEHPHRKIIDDPHNVKQSLSAVQRREAITWFGLTMGSRGLALDAATVLIMQRLHEEDLSGHILATLREQFTWICLPMRYEPPAMVEVSSGVSRVQARMPETPLGWTDPRTHRGELLWPEMFDEAKVAKLERQLSAAHGDYGVAGQLQQRPVPETGGLFERTWFPIVDALPADAQVVARTRGWDSAGTEGGGDYSCGVRLARTRDGMVYVEDVVRGQWGPQAFEGATGVLKQTIETDGTRVRQREEQEPGSAGKKVIAAHATLVFGYDYEGHPASGDKVTRARPFRAQASVGNVRLVRGSWNKAYIDELASFPHGTYDDQVDASSTAFNDLADASVGGSGQIKAPVATPHLDRLASRTSAHGSVFPRARTP